MGRDDMFVNYPSKIPIQNSHMASQYDFIVEVSISSRTLIT